MHTLVLLQHIIWVMCTVCTNFIYDHTNNQGMAKYWQPYDGRRHASYWWQKYGVKAFTLPLSLLNSTETTTQGTSTVDEEESSTLPPWVIPLAAGGGGALLIVIVSNVIFCYCCWYYYKKRRTGEAKLTWVLLMWTLDSHVNLLMAIAHCRKDNSYLFRSGDEMQSLWVH